MDDRDHGPPPHGNPSPTPSNVQPIPASSGIMAIPIYQDSTVSDHSEHIATSAHAVAKDFLDGNTSFNPVTATVNNFLDNYLFDNVNDRNTAYQETVREFTHLGYSVTANGIIGHTLLRPTPSPAPFPSHPHIATINPNVIPQFDDILNSPLTNMTSSGHPSPYATPHLSNFTVSGCHSTTPLDYILAVEAPQPTVPVNMSHFDRCSPTAPPNLAPQSHTHLTHSDSRITLPMEVDRHSPVAAKVLSRISSKWISTLTNASDPNLSYPDANLVFNNIPGPAKPLVIDSSSKNRQTCLSRIKEDIEDSFSLLLGSTTEMDRFNFIIEMANALTFDLPSVPYAIMSDLEYWRSLDFLADYRTSLYNAHQVNATLRAENAKLQQELDTIKSQQMAVAVTTSNTKHQGGKKPTKSNTTMSANQHAQMITNIISKHPDTSIDEAYKYSNAISEYVSWNSATNKGAKEKERGGGGKKKTPPPVPNTTHPNRLANMTSPKTFAQAAANPSTNTNPWQTTKWVGITRPTFRGTSNKLVKVGLKNSEGTVLPSMANLHNLSGMNLVHNIEDMICIALGGQQLLLKKAIT
ncbi:hypothetical protein AX17_005076, partial [Amanita inopinata Kibby_2008]